ncbi:MAG: sensor domain-containing diguanylate cyclase [Nitrospirae bacterium]|nr:sensor domain-containing diguanylate cyclase [Nitrospirota bacterium]
MGEGDRIKVAIIGAGREGLETLSLLRKDKAVSVSILLDPDQEALGFRLEEYGYTYSSDLNLRLSHRIRELLTLQDLNLIINTLPDRHHKDLYDLNLYPAEIINGDSARFLWELRQINEIKKRRSVITGQIDRAIETIECGLQYVPQAHPIHEQSALLLRTSFLGTHADAAQLTIIKKGDRPYQVIKDINLDPALRLKNAAKRPYIRDGDEADKIIGHVAGDKRVWEGEGETAGGWGALRVVPITEGSEVIGLLWLFYTTADPNLIKDDAAFVSSLIPVLGRTIRRVAESEDLKLASVEEALSLEPLRIIGSDRPIGSRLKEVNSFLYHLLEAEDSHLYIREPATGDLVLQATTHNLPYLLGKMRIRKGQGVLGEVIERNNPLMLMETPVGTNGHVQRIAKREDAVALLYLPLTVTDKGVGIIAMEFTNIHNINPNVYHSLSAIGQHLANTISSDAERYRMSQKIIKLSVVNEEGIELLSTFDLQKILALATASSTMLLDSEVSILRLNEDGKLVIKSTYGLHEDKVDQALLKLDNAISGMISQTKSPAIIHDVPEYVESAKSEAEYPYKTAIAVPILFNKELLGTLSVYNKTAMDVFSSLFFTEDDREILEHFTQYAARGVVNARRYNEKQLLITIDEVTGLRNERYLQMRFPEEIKRAKRFNRHVSLIFFEIKPFDDDVIRDVARLIRETFRYIDVLVRLKGGKFAALLPDTGEGVKDAVKRLSDSFDRLREKRPDLTLYTGYSTYPDDSEDMHELIKKSSRLYRY